jgi:hypothetical protein
MAIRLTWLLAAAFATLVSAHAAQVLAQTPGSDIPAQFTASTDGNDFVKREIERYTLNLPNRIRGSCRGIGSWCKCNPAGPHRTSEPADLRTEHLPGASCGLGESHAMHPPLAWQRELFRPAGTALSTHCSR